MSLTEMTQRGEEFERMPPQTSPRSSGVLGGMLLSKDAISDVIEVIRPSEPLPARPPVGPRGDPRPVRRGEPADAITVSNELTRRGELTRIGGAPYLHTLIASVPTAANAGYYARIGPRAGHSPATGRRRAPASCSSATRATPTPTIWSTARRQRSTRSPTGASPRTTHPLSEIMPAALEEIEAIGAHGGGISGVPTGFADLDSLTNGLHPGQMIVVAARPAVGKALALDTPAAHTGRWTTAMGDVQGRRLP